MASASSASPKAPSIISAPTNVQSALGGSVAAVPHAIDLWEKAAQTLSDQDKLQLDFSRKDRLVILKDVLAAVEAKKQKCMEGRWKYTKQNKDVVILRDVFEKIVRWVNTFKEVGDMVVQIDPFHAGLPWAGIRLLLQVTFSETQIFGAMAEGVEFISNLVTRYAIVEQLYLTKSSTAKDQLTNAITKLYAAVLKYLAKANSFYGRKFRGRIALSIAKTPETAVENYIKEISEMQTDVDACVVLVEATYREQMNETVENTLRGIDAMRTESEREKVFYWMTNVPYRTHHKTKNEDYLPRSCQWLQEKKEFIEWRKSSASSILWLRGIPGSGKSMLVCSFIGLLTRESSASSDPAPFAYFYCSRNAAEKERALPDEILRCILEQLSSSEVSVPIREPVTKKYAEKKREAKGRNPEKLTLAETVDVILALLETNPATIVIDALDECDPGSRSELLEALDTIILESASLVKVFVSSRDDGDIVVHLANSPNVSIRASDNKVDIKRFVHTKVDEAIQNKRLIKGNVTEELKGEITETLIDGAQGMFRWVSLQIQILCNPQRMKSPEDIRAELGRLPSSLVKSYDVIYEIISNQGAASQAMAVKTMKWLICAQRPLTSQELKAAISVDPEMANDDLLDACCNMVVLDSEVDVFRFAHLSVREYLERKGDYNHVNTHGLALERCLDSYLLGWTATSIMESTIEQNRIFRPYADLYWPVHCQTLETYQSMERHRPKLQQFLFQGCKASPLFTEWVSEGIDSSLRSLNGNDPLEEMLLHAASSPPTPLFVACSFALVSILDSLVAYENVDWNQRNKQGFTGLHLSAVKGHEAVVKVLVENGADTAKVFYEHTALHLSALRGHEAVVKVLVENGANIEAKGFNEQTALHMAAKKRHKGVARLLLKNGANPNANYWMKKTDREGKGTFTRRERKQITALHRAAEKGDDAMVKLLLENGADVNAEEEEEERLGADIGSDLETLWLIRGRTPLHLAAKEGRNAVVKLLLGNGANINAVLNRGPDERMTALDLAIEEGHEEVIRLLRSASTLRTDL